jgi:hypothetical protein
MVLMSLGLLRTISKTRLVRHAGNEYVFGVCVYQNIITAVIETRPGTRYSSSIFSSGVVYGLRPRRSEFVVELAAAQGATPLFRLMLQDCVFLFYFYLLILQLAYSPQDPWIVSAKNERG